MRNVLVSFIQNLLCIKYLDYISNTFSHLSVKTFETIHHLFRTQLIWYTLQKNIKFSKPHQLIKTKEKIEIEKNKKGFGYRQLEEP